VENPPSVAAFAVLLSKAHAERSQGLSGGPISLEIWDFHVTGGPSAEAPSPWTLTFASAKAFRSPKFS
jgi:hypothetical protein